MRLIVSINNCTVAALMHKTTRSRWMFFVAATQVYLLSGNLAANTCTTESASNASTRIYLCAHKSSHKTIKFVLMWPAIKHDNVTRFMYTSCSQTSFIPALHICKRFMRWFLVSWIPQCDYDGNQKSRQRSMVVIPIISLLVTFQRIQSKLGRD